MSAGQHQSKTELDRKLDHAGITAGRNDAAEIPGTPDNLSGRGTERCRWDGADVANRICKIDLIQKIKDFGPQFKRLRLAESETLYQREVQVRLFGPAQNVATNVTQIGPSSAGNRRTLRTGDNLTSQNNRSSKREWIEIIYRWSGGCCCAQSGAGRPAWANLRVITSSQTEHPARASL